MLKLFVKALEFDIFQNQKSLSNYMLSDFAFLTITDGEFPSEKLCFEVSLIYVAIYFNFIS